MQDLKEGRSLTEVCVGVFPEDTGQDNVTNTWSDTYDNL